MLSCKNHYRLNIMSILKYGHNTVRKRDCTAQKD